MITCYLLLLALLNTLPGSAMFLDKISLSKKDHIDFFGFNCPSSTSVTIQKEHILKTSSSNENYKISIRFNNDKPIHVAAFDKTGGLENAQECHAYINITKPENIKFSIQNIQYYNKKFVEKLDNSTAIFTSSFAFVSSSHKRGERHFVNGAEWKLNKTSPKSGKLPTSHKDQPVWSQCGLRNDEVIISSDIKGRYVDLIPYGVDFYFSVEKCQISMERTDSLDSDRSSSSSSSEY
jgi:hypothetical protein